MIILICNFFSDEGLLVDSAYNMETGETVIVPCMYPSELGGVFDRTIGEWVIR